MGKDGTKVNTVHKICLQAPGNLAGETHRQINYYNIIKTIGNKNAMMEV